MLTCPFEQMPDPAHETDKKREFFQRKPHNYTKLSALSACIVRPVPRN